MPIRERVLITGAAAGIGRATADRCRAEGYEVVGVDRDGDGIRAGHPCGGGCPARRCAPLRAAECLEPGGARIGPIDVARGTDNKRLRVGLSHGTRVVSRSPGR